MELFIFMLFVSIMVISCAGIAAGYAAGRRKYKLAMHQEERRRIEARTREIEAQNQRVELEYQQAMLEIDRFDRRGWARTDVASAPAPDRADDASRTGGQR